MELASDGQYNIYVRPGGVLWILDNSTIRSSIAYTYTLYVEEGGELLGHDSYLYNLGPGVDGGLYVEGNATHKGTARLYSMTLYTSSLTSYNASIEVFDSILLEY